MPPTHHARPSLRAHPGTGPELRLGVSCGALVADESDVVLAGVVAAALRTLSFRRTGRNRGSMHQSTPAPTRTVSCPELRRI